jgi:SM-20-related protein
MEEEISSRSRPLELNATLDTSVLKAAFRKNFALHVENFLSPASAVGLYENFTHEVEWRSFVVSKETIFAAPAGLRDSYSPEQEKELFDCAYEGASSGFAYLYDANRQFVEDIPDGAHMEDFVEAPFWLHLTNFVNSKEFLNFMREVTGVWGIDRAAIKATRFRSGHFEMFNAATFSGDVTGKRVATFNLNLTPEWKPEWGGLLEFRRPEAGSIDAFVPTFNSLDVLGFPVGYWISHVAPFAGGARLAIAGRLYREG